MYGIIPDIMENRILVVDDEKPIVDILKINLEKNGYKVICAYDGEMAIEKAFSEEPDLILLDVMLPKTDGFSVCKKIREKSSVPIIMLTAREEEVDKVLGLELGADDYMTKPIDLEELLLRIGALLRRAKIAASHRLEVGCFVMDADEHTAYLNEEEIVLTNREFSILYKMLSYPKKTFTRTQLMDEFWDADTETAPRAVDVYMTKLRAKLVDCEDFKITTVHGLGYKVVLK